MGSYNDTFTIDSDNKVSDPNVYIVFNEAGSGSSYDWTQVIMLEKNGHYFMAEDSGCSCYGPWEGVYTLSDLTEVFNEQDVTKFLRDVSSSYFSDADKLDIVRKARDVLGR